MKEAADKKKTYETPELVTYGDVRVLTATVGTLQTAKNDGGRTNSKTA